MPRQIPGYATHIKQISETGKYMSGGGALAIGPSGISTRLEIDQVCNASLDSAACEKVKFTPHGKLGSSVVGSYFGGAVGGPVLGKVCVAVATATAGTGGVVCLIVAGIGTGLGAYYGGELGASTGEHLGEILYEATKHE